MRAVTVLVLYAWAASALSIPNVKSLHARAAVAEPSPTLPLAQDFDLDHIADGARSLLAAHSPPSSSPATIQASAPHSDLSKTSGRSQNERTGTAADTANRQLLLDSRKRQPEPIWTRRPGSSAGTTPTAPEPVVGTSRRTPTTQASPADDTADLPSKTNVAHVHGPDNHSAKPHFHAGLHDVAADTLLCSNCPAAEPYGREEGARRQRLMHAEKAEVNRLIGDAHMELNKARHDDLLSEAQAHAKLEAYVRQGAHRRR